jgi:hypothetical protein
LATVFVSRDEKARATVDSMVATSRFKHQSFRVVLAFSILLFARGVSAVEAYEPPPLSWIQDSWGTSMTGEYFSTNTNYDQTRGSFTRLVGNNTLTNFTSHVRGRYGLTTSTALFTGFGFAQTNVKDALGERAGSSITDLTIGADFILWRRWFKAIVEAQGGYPIDAVDRQQKKPLTSDGVPFGRIGLFVYKPFRQFRLTGYAGVDYPTEGLSKKFLYQIYGEIPVRQFLIGGGVNGYEAFLADSLSQAERQATPIVANAQSLRFYAFEPALLEARGWVGFRPSKSWSIRAGYAKTLNGLRTAEGQSFIFSLAFNAKDLFGTSVETLEEDARSVSPDANFVSDRETTDQSLFRDEPPPKPKRIVAPPKTPGAIDSLDQTEKLLERRKKK